MHVDLMRKAEARMPEIAEAECVRTMRIWHCRYKSLDQIVAFKHLEQLVIGTYPGTTLDPIGALKQLRYLKIVHLPRISEIGPLSQLAELERLSLATNPSWDAQGKVTEIESLDPLTSLRKLRHVELFGVVPASRSPDALIECRELASARFSHFDRSLVAAFYATTNVRDDFVPQAGFEHAANLPFGPH